MTFQETSDGNSLIFRHERLHAVLTFGHCASPFADLERLESEEIAVGKEPLNPLNREFYALHQFRPPVDLTLSRPAGGSETTFLSIGFDLSAMKTLEEMVVTHLDFASAPVPSKIRASLLAYELALEGKTYMLMQIIASLGTESIEDVFGAMRYGNFLKRYKGYSDDNDALRKSKRKYGVE